MKTITIKSGALGRYDDVSPFLLADNRLELMVKLPELGGEFYFVSELVGATQKKYIPRGEPIVLNDLHAGELHAEVKHYLRGTLINRYKVEPLIIREVDSDLSGTPEIALLTAKYGELQERLNVVTNRLQDEFEGRLTALSNRLQDELQARNSAEKELLEQISKKDSEISELSRRISNLENEFDPLRG